MVTGFSPDIRLKRTVNMKRINLLVGRYFLTHVWDNFPGCVDGGKVLAEVSPGLYLVQLIKAGALTDAQKTVTIKSMDGWIWYDTFEALRAAKRTGR